jgi:uncharacterized membrane protein
MGLGGTLRRMSPEDIPPAPADPRSSADYESSPLARAEYVSAIVHLYRGELHRANAWRIRLDNTTNWAVLTTAGLLTFTFGEGSHSHWVLLIGMALVSVFLAFEARRYRFADVWRMRVRKIEENFYGPILRRNPVSPIEDWGNLVADDLFNPHFKITRMQAVRARLLRNYWPIYVVVIGAWIVHVLTFTGGAVSGQTQNWSEVRATLGSGLLPWWFPLGVVISIVTVLVGIAFFVTPPTRSDEEAWLDPVLSSDDRVGDL